MSRLIDADEFIVKLCQDQPMDCTGSDAEVQELHDWELFRNMVDNAPTVDAEIVVRCRDCAVPHNKYTGCPMLNGLVTPPDFYCPFGERKDGDDNG